MTVDVKRATHHTAVMNAMFTCLFITCHIEYVLIPLAFHIVIHD